MKYIQTSYKMISEWIVGLVFFIVILVFIVILIVAWTKSNNLVPITPSLQIGLLGANCLETPCENSLVCDGTTFTCKQPLGARCNDFSDCLAGQICSGVCAEGPFGGFNQLCPCESGLLCVPFVDAPSRCRGAGDYPCTVNDQCASNLCNPDNKCSFGAPNSYPCTNNANCASLNCSGGFCQAFGFTTATQGAACASPCVEFTGAGCGAGLSCACLAGVNEIGTCITSDQGIAAPCSNSAPCAENLVCINNLEPSLCNSDICNCVFPYQNPNVGPNCISGMTNLAGVCYNASGLPCSENSQCVGLCGGSSQVSTFLFNGVMTNIFLGATDIAVQSIFQGPGVISPHKTLSTTVGAFDTLYLVDNERGLLTTTYNVASKLATEWIVLIPRVNGGRILVDVAMIPGTNSFLVAFNETVGSLQNYTLYTWNRSTFTPFNVRTIGNNIPGTQFVDVTPLTINYIDVSMANDVASGGDVLISGLNGTVYVKVVDEVVYSVARQRVGNNQPLININGVVSFYFDVEENPSPDVPAECPLQRTSPLTPIACGPLYNIAYVSDAVLNGSGRVVNSVLQFSGNINGYLTPVDNYNLVQYEVYSYSIYSPVPTGMNSARAILLCRAYDQNGVFIDNVVTVNDGASMNILPYKAGSNTAVWSTANAYYLMDSYSCQG